MRFTVTLEDVAFLRSPKKEGEIELELGEHELRGFSEVRQQEGTFPAGILAVTKVRATPDDSVYKEGRDGDEVKLFVSIDLLVEADGQDEAEAISPPLVLLTTLTDMLPRGAELDLEGNWEVLESEAVAETSPAI